MHRRARIGALALLTTVATPSAARLTLAEFEGDRFGYTFGGFNEAYGSTSVRLNDPIDGWGGAGVVFGSPRDFTEYADASLVIDFTPGAGNLASDFTIEFIEELGGGERRSGKWTFPLTGLEPGVAARVTASTPLSQPTSGLGDFGNLDLADISRWQLLGVYESPDPFDVTFDRVSIVGPYDGFEASATWRAEAEQRIEALRKADLTMHVVDAAGLPAPNADVRVAMQQHAFGFGSAVRGYAFRDDAPEHDAYKQKVAELFNVGVPENSLKWPPWEGEWGDRWNQAGGLAALDWLAAQGIEARGHAMVWPGVDNLPEDLALLFDDGSLTVAEQQTVRDRIAAHIAAIGAATDGKVVAWDVVNEPRTNNDLMRELIEGDAAIADWFHQARAASPDAALYVNDFGILNSWGQDAVDNRDRYFATIEQLLDEGATIDGIGFQGHFFEEDLTGPEELWAILDRFQTLGLDMQVTEFDVDMTDEVLQGRYTRDFLTAMFAHEGIDDVILWGFWEDAHWRPDAALFRSDWSVKPNGQAYLDLVFGEWWTDEQLRVDEDGATKVRAFKGEHAVTATFAGESAEATIDLEADGAATVALDLVVGDYNGDGRVNAADYTVWRDAASPGFQTTETPDGDNNGVIDEADRVVWAARYGAATLSPVTLVPEPSSFWLVVAAVTLPRRGR